jgi:tape measure domain-containing protein
MADTIRVIKIEIDASQAAKGLAEMGKGLDKLDRSVSAIANSVDSFERVARSFLGAYLGTQGVRAILSAADAFTKFENALKTAGVEASNLALVQDRLFAAANKNGVEIGALGQVYGRLTMSAKELGASTNDMLKFVDGVTAALKVQGGSTEQASGALLQLSQAMGAGIVRAEEFNSVLEGALPIAQAAARGIDGMGGSIAKLRTAVTEGKVTSQQFFQGLLKGFSETEAQAEKSTLTMAAALTSVENSWTRFIGELDKTMGASQIAVAGLNNISKALAEIADQLARGAANGKGFWSTVLDDSRRTGRMGGLRLSTPEEEAQDRLKALQAERNSPAAQGRESMIDDEIRKLQISRQVDFQADEDWARRYKPDPVAPSIAPPPSLGKGGQALQDRIDKLKRDTRLELDAANAYAAASERGAKAVADLEVHFNALKAAQDAYGDTADKNKDQVAKLTDEIEKQMRVTERAKNLKDFNVSTEELERSNALLAAENALINASAEDRARELALIRLKNDVQAKGLDESNQKEKEAIERREAAITSNERLKAQGEELKRANELWTEPLKNALQSIQQTGADWIESLLNGLLEGKLAVEDFGKAGIGIAKRMVAEFLSLAIIRPMMQSIVGGLGSIGLVSPNMASSLGFGSGMGGSSMSMPNTGLGGIFGGGGTGGGGLGSIFPFWNSPISFGSAPNISTPASMVGPTGMSGASLGGLTWGQGIGAIGGFASGAMQLFGGGGSTKSTIGGISSMVGAAVSLIPGVGQILGPIISLAGPLLGGLFGDEGYKWPPLAAGGINFQPGKDGFFNDEWTINGGQAVGGGYGDKINWGQVSGVGVWSNQREGTTSSFVLNPGPTGMPSQIGEKDGDGTPLIEEAIAKAWAATISRGGVSGVSDTLMTAVNNKPWMDFNSVGQVRQLISFTEAYDNLGETTTQAEKALKDIDASFAELTASAKEYGLSLDPIEEEKGKKRKEYAEGILDEIESMFDPVGVALKKFNKERDAGLKELEYIAANVKDVYVDMAKVSEYYARKEEQLRDQLYQGAVDSLEAAIKRLTVGDLANVSPTTQFTGLKATYNATLAQARAGDADAIGRLSGEGLAYAEAGRTYYASSPEYQALVEELRKQLAEVQAAIQAPRSGTGGTPLDVQAEQIRSSNVDRLAELVQDLSQQNADLQNQLATTNMLLRSMIANR